jgi:hypothetical protein
MSRRTIVRPSYQLCCPDMRFSVNLHDGPNTGDCSMAMLYQCLWRKFGNMSRATPQCHSANIFFGTELKAHAKNRDLGQVPIPRFCAGTGRDMGDLRGTAGQGTFEHD